MPTGARCFYPGHYRRRRLSLSLLLSHQHDMEGQKGEWSNLCQEFVEWEGDMGKFLSYDFVGRTECMIRGVCPFSLGVEEVSFSFHDIKQRGPQVSYLCRLRHWVPAGYTKSLSAGYTKSLGIGFVDLPESEKGRGMRGKPHGPKKGSQFYNAL